MGLIEYRIMHKFKAQQSWDGTQGTGTEQMDSNEQLETQAVDTMLMPEYMRTHVRLTLPMLRLLSSRIQGCKEFRRSCHVGIHWIALTEYSDEYPFAMVSVIFCAYAFLYWQH